MKKLFLLIAALGSAVLLSACGGGDDEPPVQGAVAPATFAINASTGATVTSAVRGQAFTFTAPVADLGTTATTTVAFTAPATTSTNPDFAIATPSTGESASGQVEFGSCRFRVQRTTYRSGPLATVGNLITIANCAVRFEITNTPADNTQEQRGAQLILNNSTSLPVLVIVVITPSGQLIVNSVTLGTVPLAPITGAATL